MKKLFELTKNLKPRWLLHLIAGALIGLPIVFLPIHWFFAGMLIGIICWIIADKWERFQVKEYGANYDDWDVRVTVLGGLIMLLIGLI